MIIQFDKNKMHVQVLVGVSEKYEPTDAVMDIYNKAEILKKKMDDFYKQEVETELKEIEVLVSEHNAKYIPNK